MGCWYPLREIVTKALGKCNGHERWREEDQRMNYAMAYPPGAPTETHYMRPGARTVTFSGTNSVHMIPPNPQGRYQQQAPEPQQHQAPPPQHDPDHQHQPDQPTPAPEQGAPPQGEQPRQPRRGKKKPPRRVRFGPDQQPPQQQQQESAQEQQQQQPEHAPGHPGHGPHGPTAGHQHHGHGPHGPAAGPPGYFRYAPSPLPRWEATPRRHEYFSGEYRHSYPTPVREGIYSLATDANRLTTIFSEENPNACAIA